MDTSNMPTRDPRQIPQKLWRKAVLVPFIYAGTITAMAWIAYIAYRIFHYDLLGSDHHVTDDYFGQQRGMFYLGLALFLTVGGLLGAWLIGRTQLHVVRHGAIVTGRITGLANTTYKGLRKIEVQYEVDGKTHKYAASDGQVAITNGLILGDPVTVYVHPNKPDRAVVLYESPTLKDV